MQKAIQKDLGQCAFDEAKKPPARSSKAKVLLEPNQGRVSRRHEERGRCHDQGKDTDISHREISVQTDNQTTQDGTFAAEFGEQIVFNIHLNKGNNTKEVLVWYHWGNQNCNQNC